MSRAQRRYIRTIVLGVCALAALVWSAVDLFDVPVEDMGQLFLGTVIAVGVVIVAAALTVALLAGLRRLLRGSPE
jgi:hypothetical protein